MQTKSPSHFLRFYGPEAAAVCTLVSAVLLFSQSHFGYPTRILGLGDEGLLWYVSQRTSLGDVPLRDFFSYDPGRYYWSALIFKLFRRDGLFQQIIADDLFGWIGLFVTYIVMCRLEIDRRWRVAAVVLLGVAMGFPRHKIYEQTLSLIAVASVTFVLVKPASKRWLCYGLATGLAAFVGRNSGLYFCVAALLTLAMLKLLHIAFPARRAICAYAIGIMIGYLPMLVMVVSIHGFAPALWRSILLNSKQLIPIPVPFPWRLHAMGLHGLQPLAVSILFLAAPVTYILCLFLFPRPKAQVDGEDERWLVYGASIAGLPYLFHAFSYAAFGHLAQASLPFIVASVAISGYLFKKGRRGLSLGVMAGLVGLVLACWVPREPAVEYFRARDHFEPIEIQNTKFLLPRGDAELLLTAQLAFERCGAQDGTFLASPNYPTLYAYLRTRSPFWEVYFILLRVPRNEGSQTKHIEALIQNRTSLLLLGRDDEKAMEIVYPRLIDYIRTHYQKMNIASNLGYDMYYLPQSCGN